LLSRTEYGTQNSNKANVKAAEMIPYVYIGNKTFFIINTSK